MMKSRMEEKHYLYGLSRADLEAEVKRMIEHYDAYSREDLVYALLLLSSNLINYSLADRLASLCIDSPDYWVKNMAVLSVGHMARVYGCRVNQGLYDKVVEIFADRSNPLWGASQSALCDLRMFLKIPLPEVGVTT
jgi:hypothetical protein